MVGILLRLFYGWAGIVLLVFGVSLIILGVTSQPKDFLAYWSFDFGIVAYGFSLATLYFSERDNENQSKELKRLADEVKGAKRTTGQMESLELKRPQSGVLTLRKR